MEQISAIQLIFGSITSILLSVVAYFIKQLQKDFRKMERDLTEVKFTTMLIKTEFKSQYDILFNRLNHLEKRVEIIENIKLKNIPMKTKEMNLVERIQSPTPKFFKKLRNIGLILGATSAAILASPVALPVAIVSVAGYMAVACGVITAVSQTAVQSEEDKGSGK